MNEKALIPLAEGVVKNLTAENKTLAVAESCTGGWLSKLITDVSGASAVYKGGVCSYSNDVKMSILGVKKETLETEGAVSHSTAEQMAQGVRKALNADYGIGITGIAGPKSDNTQKPVGLIFVAFASETSTQVIRLENKFTTDIRNSNRLSALETALNILASLGGIINE